MELTGLDTTIWASYSCCHDAMVKGLSDAKREYSMHGHAGSSLHTLHPHSLWIHNLNNEGGTMDVNVTPLHVDHNALDFLRHVGDLEDTTMVTSGH